MSDDETRQQQVIGEVEAALRSLRLRPSRIDRDRLMFRAGQLSAARPGALRRVLRSRWLWPSVAAAMALIAVTLGATLVLHLRSHNDSARYVVNPTRGWQSAPKGNEPDQLAKPNVKLTHVLLPAAPGVGPPSVPVVFSSSEIERLAALSRQPKHRFASQPILIYRAGGEPVILMIVIPEDWPETPIPREADRL
jgi:hypothetical protein